MASFLEDLLKKMKNAPHVGIPKATNPKVPTKVERDVAEYVARERAKPKADYGSGSSFDQLMQRIASSQHPAMKFGDPAFGPSAANNWWPGIDDFETEYEAWMTLMKAKKQSNGNV